MRLHRLVAQAFGPFPELVEVDFDRLGADGLFLVHGDTGAGKTSLLDAVAFALFGRVPGPRNEAKRLRCDRAHPHLRTEVRLEATIGGHRIELIRNPEYRRAKTRGDGTTLERHRVLLRWLDVPAPGADPAGLTRADEVGDAIADLLGHVRRPVLPGRAAAAGRVRPVPARRHHGSAGVCWSGCSTPAGSAPWRSGSPRPGGSRPSGCDPPMRRWRSRPRGSPRRPTGRCRPLSTNEWLVDLRDRLADAADVAAWRAERARIDLAEAATTAEGLRDESRRVQALRRLLDRRAELDREEPELARLRAAVLRHAAAAPVVALARAARDAEQHRRRAERAWHQAATALGEFGPIVDVAATSDGEPALWAEPPTADAARKQAAADRELAGSLAPLLELATEQDRDRVTLEATRARHHRIEEAAADAEQQLAQLPQTIDELERQVVRARSARDSLAGASAEYESAARRAKAAAALPGLRERVAELTAAALAATAAHQSAVDARQQLVEQRIAGMAGELAVGLRDRLPCPVCGAVEHPRPAAGGHVPVGAERIEAARQSEAAAAERREQAAAERAAAEAELVAVASISEELSVADARRAKRRAATTRDRLATLARTLDALLGRRDAAGKRHFELSLRRDDLAQQLALTSAELARLTAAITRHAAELDAARGAHESVAKRRRFLVDRAAAWERCAVTAERHAAAEQDEVRAAARASDAAAAAGFAGVRDALTAAEIDPERSAARVQQGADARAAVAAQLADPTLAGLDPGAEVPLADAERAASLAAERAERAIAEADAAGRRRVRVTEAAAALAAARDRRLPVAAEAAELAALADVLAGRGQNALGMSLRTYVLAARLHQVATAASRRLERMTAARYTFVPSTDRESRGRAGGLGLDILDALVRTAAPHQDAVGRGVLRRVAGPGARPGGRRRRRVRRSPARHAVRRRGFRQSRPRGAGHRDGHAGRAAGGWPRGGRRVARRGTPAAHSHAGPRAPHAARVHRGRDVRRRRHRAGLGMTPRHGEDGAACSCSLRTST